MPCAKLCLQQDRTPQVPHGHVARDDVAGGSTAIAEACLTTTTRTASAARASPGLARAKRQQLRVLGPDHLNARQRRGGVGRVLVRGSGGEWQRRRGVPPIDSEYGDARSACR